MLKKFWLDTIWGFFFIIGMALFVNGVSHFKIFDVFDPFGDALADMEMTDIIYSQDIRPDPVAEEDIVLINIGNLDRRGIAELVSIVNMAEPAVIGMDMVFPYPKEDTLGDMKLSMAFASVKNLVMYSKLINHDDDDSFDSLELSDQSLFNYGQTAFVNFITGAANQEDLKVCRTFAPSEEVNGEEELAFSVKLAQYIAPEKVENFLARDNDIEVINFRGNIFDYGATKAPITYFALDWYQVLNGEFAPDLLKDKIIIFCFLGNELGDRESLEDKYFTPLNAKYAGKASADMFGGVVHANCISMILSEDYIDNMGETMSYIWAAILLYLNVILFVFIYKVMPKWYDGLSKLIQLIEVFTLFTLVLLIYTKFNYKIDVTTAFIGVLLSGDALEIYFGVVKNLFTKEGRKDLGKIKKL